MSNIDAVTPQLKLVKDWICAYGSHDFGDLQTYVSRNLKFQTFPKIVELPDESVMEHMERYKLAFSFFTSLEVHAHEVIEAPGKVVLQVSAVGSTLDDNTFEYDSVIVITIVEEDGELKILDVKDFSDPEKRGKINNWAAKIHAMGGLVA